jgi:hypothetical protein
MMRRAFDHGFARICLDVLLDHPLRRQAILRIDRAQVSQQRIAALGSRRAERLL